MKVACTVFFYVPVFLILFTASLDFRLTSVVIPPRRPASDLTEFITIATVLPGASHESALEMARNGNIMSLWLHIIDMGCRLQLRTLRLSAPKDGCK